MKSPTATLAVLVTVRIQTKKNSEDVGEALWGPIMKTHMPARFSVTSMMRSRADGDPRRNTC